MKGTPGSCPKRGQSSRSSATSCAAQNLGGAYSKAVIFAQAANMTGLLLSETGGNKSGMLEFFLAAAHDYMALYGQEFMLTDFTTEALCSAMADNAGRVLVTMHEAKKLFFTDQYKTKGDGKERMMEFQAPPFPPRSSPFAPPCPTRHRVRAALPHLAPPPAPWLRTGRRRGRRRAQGRRRRGGDRRRRPRRRGGR